MLGLASIGGHKRGAAALALGVGVLAVLAPRAARAHFTLDAPPNWQTQTAQGSPQKLGPCGDEGGGTPTGIVTTYQAGQTITLQWTETVGHDGWYRIAISYADRTDFTDPPVTFDPSSGFSLDAGIENPPVMPVLADGLFPHSGASITSNTPYSYDLTLPTTPCAKCTLQVIQFMANHSSNLGNLADGSPNPDGYFYHHCADISIAPLPGADAETSTDAAAPDGASDAATPGDAAAPNDAASPGDGALSGDAAPARDAGASSDAGARPGSAPTSGGGAGGCAVAPGDRDGIAGEARAFAGATSLSALVGALAFARAVGRRRRRARSERVNAS